MCVESEARLHLERQDRARRLRRTERLVERSREESDAYDLAAALNGGTPLSGRIFRAARELFGERGLAEIVFLAGCSCMVSVLLNAYDVTVPGDL
jgi:4-carboxymuconolactone decarboxylase